MARVRAGHSFWMRTSEPVPTSSPPPTTPWRRARTPLRLGVMLLAALVVAAVLLQPSAPPLPIPTPPNLGALDPQIRAHLATLARHIAKAPQDPEARAEMGLAFAVNGLWTEARQAFLQTLELGGPQPLPALYAAVALQEMGDDPGATRELRQLVDRSPGFAPGWHRLGRALINTADLPGAAEAFTQVTRLAPEAWHGWAGLGEALVRAGRPGDAIPHLEKARQLAPAEKPVHHLLGQAYRASGRSEEADREAAMGGSQFLGPMPDAWSPRALTHMKSLSDLFERSDMLLATGRAPEAVECLREALQYHPENATVIASLARALNSAGQEPTAWRLLTNALAHLPPDVTLFARAAETAAALEQSAEALAFAGKALELGPKSAEAHVAQANALLAAGSDTEAAHALEEALRLAPRDATLRLQFGDVLLHNLHQPERARQAWEEARTIAPLDPAPWQRLATLALDLRQPQEARRCLGALEALQLSPEWTGELRRAIEKLEQASAP